MDLSYTPLGPDLHAPTGNLETANILAYTDSGINNFRTSGILSDSNLPVTTTGNFNAPTADLATADTLPYTDPGINNFRSSGILPATNMPAMIMAAGPHDQTDSYGPGRVFNPNFPQPPGYRYQVHPFQNAAFGIESTMVAGPTAMWQGMPVKFSRPHPYARQTAFSTGSHPTARSMSTGSLGIYNGTLGAETESLASHSEVSSTLAPPPSSAALYQAQLSQMKANVTAQTVAKFENHLVLTCQVIMKHSTISSETRIPKDLKHLITEFWNQSAREVAYPLVEPLDTSTIKEITQTIPATRRSLMHTASTIVECLEPDIYPGPSGPVKGTSEYNEFVTQKVDALQTDFAFCDPSAEVSAKKLSPAYFSNEIFWDGIFKYLYKDHSSFAVQNPRSFQDTIPLEIISDVAIAVIHHLDCVKLPPQAKRPGFAPTRYGEKCVTFLQKLCRYRDDEEHGPGFVHFLKKQTKKGWVKYYATCAAASATAAHSTSDSAPGPYLSADPALHEFSREAYVPSDSDSADDSA